jgi:hypothetical protein
MCFPSGRDLLWELENYRVLIFRAACKKISILCKLIGFLIDNVMKIENDQANILENNKGGFI